MDARVRKKLEHSGWTIGDAKDLLDLTEAEAAYHPAFGHEQTAHRLLWRYHGPLPLRVQTQLAIHVSTASDPPAEVALESRNGPARSSGGLR